jgi:ligand-binding sensor domain-containing protein/signal transduction histidine kinase
MRLISLPLANLVPGIALLAVLTAPLQAWAVETEWLVRDWQTEDGLPDNTITAIQQTPDGYLWLGTFNGLTRFDGVQFKTFDSANTPELRSSHILSLLADPSGRLWIGTEEGGLARMADGHFESVPLAGVGPAESISAMFRERNGALWFIVTDKGAVRLQDGRTQLFKDNMDLADDKLPTLTTDPAVRAWLTARNDLLTFRAGSWFSRPSQVPPSGSEIIAIQRSRNGNVWLGYPRQIAKLMESDETADRITRSWGNEFSSALVTTLVEDQDGKLWVGTLNNGLFYSAQDGGFQPVRAEGLLSQNVITALLEDQQGIIWAGTYRGGLFRIKRRTVTTLSPPGAGEVNVQTACAARDGSVWLGTGGAGLFRYAEGKFTHYSKADGLSNLHVCSVFEDRRTNLWVGTWGGLFLLENDRFQRVIPSTNFPERVLALYEDRAGNLWSGTYGGLARKQGENWTLFTPADGLSNPDVRVLAEDREGNLWVGTAGGGLDRFRDGHFTHFGADEGFPQKMVLALLADKDDTLWIGSIGGGLARYKEGKFISFTTQDGLADNVIGGLIEDTVGNLWLSSQNGILRVSKAALNHYERGLGEALPCLSLSVGDGLATLMCSGAGQPVAARTADGQLWIPNMKAVAIVNPQLAQLASLPPVTVKVEEVSIDGQIYIPQEGDLLRMPFGRSRFEFHYTALGLPVPEAVRFRHKLEGIDAEWVNDGVKRLASYSQLPPGKYSFRIMAVGGDGVWHEAATPLELQIVPHWWETWWFRFSLGAASLVIVGLAIRMIERRKLHGEIERIKRQRVISEERTRIARDIHDDMGSRLTAISLLGALALRESSPAQTVREDVSRMMKKTHELVSTLDEIVWAVNPKNDSLGHLATYLCQFAQEFLEPTAVVCRLDVVPGLPALVLTSEVRHNVFLATREALNNVVKHANATKIWLRLKIEAGAFVIELADDGRGFSPDARMATGDGLHNMSRRLADIGGQFEIRSAPAQGTTVCFRLPLTQLGDATIT